MLLPPRTHDYYVYTQVMEEVLASNEAKAAVLISSKPGCFIAGADVKWLDRASSKQDVSTVWLEVLVGNVWQLYWMC